MAVTIRDVANKAGVTIGTVSRAFNGYDDIRPETKEKIMLIARDLGYIPNFIGRSLSSKRPRNVGLIISGLLEGNPKDNFVYMLLQGIYRYTTQSGLEITVYTTDSEEQRKKSYSQFCEEHSIYGVILNGITTDDVYFTDLVESKIPCVVIDVPAQGKSLGWVSIDNIAATKELACHLIENGHRDIMVVSGKKNAAVNLERIAGVFEAYKEAGLELTSERLVYADFSEQRAYELTLSYLRNDAAKHCTAFLCFSDIMALGVLKALKESGKKVPDDYSVVGFDGISLTEYTSPPLTTIWQNVPSMGYEAAMLLHKMMHGAEGEHRIINHQLLIRDSVSSL